MLITRFYILGLFDIYHACPSQTCFPISSRHCRFWHKSKAGDPWDMCLVLEWEQLKNAVVRIHAQRVLSHGLKARPHKKTSEHT